MKRASLTRPQRLSPFSLAVFALATDLSFEYGLSLAFAKNTTVLQSRKYWFLRREENLNTRRRKTSRSRVENQQQTQPTYDAGSGNRTRDTLVGGERSHHCANPSSCTRLKERLLRVTVCVFLASLHRRTGRGPGCSPPPIFWTTQIFWAAREIWAKPVFKGVFKLCF